MIKLVLPAGARGAVTLTARQKIIYSVFHNRFWEGRGFSRAATTGITLGFSP